MPNLGNSGNNSGEYFGNSGNNGITCCRIPAVRAKRIALCNICVLFGGYYCEKAL